MREDFTLWMVNLFGDLIVLGAGGSVDFFDIGVGQISKIDDSQDHFVECVDQGDNANNWFAVPLVDACMEAGIRLGPDQCYGYKIPPFMGRTYDIDNIEPTDLSVHYSLIADIWRQTQDLPEGAKIRHVVTK